MRVRAGNARASVCVREFSQSCKVCTLMPFFKPGVVARGCRWRPLPKLPMRPRLPMPLRLKTEAVASNWLNHTSPPPKKLTKRFTLFFARTSLSSRASVCVRVCARERVRVCVRERERVREGRQGVHLWTHSWCSTFLLLSFPVIFF